MNASVEKALADLRRQFAGHELTHQEDGCGGAYFFIQGVDVGSGFTPRVTWLGGRITAAFPFTDIYPLYINGALRRANNQALAAPLVSIPSGWEGRPAIQVSRINRNAANEPMTASLKVARVIDFLRRYA